LYSSPSIIGMIKSRRMRWTGDVACIGRRGMDVGLLVGKPEEKKPLGSSRRRWVYNIKMDLRELGWGGMDWIDLAQDRGQWRLL
jgi:hypothetical protein